MSKTVKATLPPIDGGAISTLQQHRRGACLTDLSAAIRDVVAAVNATGRAGGVTLKLTIKPAGKKNAGELIVEDDIITKLPKEEKGGSIFYADDDNNLRRDDPNQRNLELREVPEPVTHKPLKEAEQPAKVASA